MSKKHLIFAALILEANHNKDYSVVKTFGKPLRHTVGGIFCQIVMLAKTFMFTQNGAQFSVLTIPTKQRS
jgi:hypothetical protein